MLSTRSNVQTARLAAFKPTSHALRRGGLRVRAAPKAKMIRINAAMAPTVAPTTDSPQWGPEATVSLNSLGPQRAPVSLQFFEAITL